MSGHSKWSTIKRKKALVDAKRSKVWTKVIKEITVAARMGGADASANPRLRLAIDKAKAANVPSDNVQRAIKKGTGDLDGVSYDETTYEGYGPGGVAVLIEVMTDNKNRTVSEIRNAFDKHGGNMGNAGSVAWIFKKRGLIAIEKANASEDQLMELAIEAGADDVRDGGEFWEIETDPTAYEAVKDAIDQAKIDSESAELTMIPENRVKLDEGKAQTMLNLIDAMEDNDDVQNVYANFDIADDILERLLG